MSETGTSVQVIRLDISGQVCPASLLVTLRKINENKDSIHRGEVRLDVVTDSRDAVSTISEAASNMGYKVGVEKTEGEYLLSVSAQG